MKKLLILFLTLTIISVAIFANGQNDTDFVRGRGMTNQDDFVRGQNAMVQECYVDGEFSIELFLENSPMTERLDADGDGIVDGTDTTIEAFIEARTEDIPMGRRNSKPRGGRRN